MAVAYESDGGTVFAASASNAAITVPLPATRPVGSVLYLIGWSRLLGDSLATVPSGYTSLGVINSATASGGTIVIYARVVDGSESAPTIAFASAVTGNSGDLWGACIFCYSGVDTSGTLAQTLDGTPTVTDASGTTTCTYPALTITNDNAMIVRFLARFQDLAVTFTPTGGWNEREDASSIVRTGGQFHLQDLLATASGSQAAVTVAPSSSTATRYLAVTLALKSRLRPVVADTVTVTDSVSPVLTSPLRAYDVEVLADSPKAYWRLGASPLVDASGNSNTLTASTSAPTSAASLLTGVPGDGSRDFSGSSQYYTAPDSTSLSLTGPLTIEAWVVPDSISGVTTIVRKDSIQFALRNNGGTLEYYYDDGAARGVGKSGALTAAALHHIVVTDDLTTVRFYIDGALVASPARSTGTPATDTAGAVAIGATYSGGSPSEFFDGRIDEVALYGTALSASRIAIHYQAGITLPPGPEQTISDTVTVTDTTGAGAGIAVDKVSLGNNKSNTSATTITLTTTNAVAANGFVALGISWYDAATVTVSGGGLTWTTNVARNTAGTPNVAIASAQAPSGLASGTVLTVTFSTSVVARAVCGTSFTGVAPSSAFDVSANNTATAAAWTTGAATPAEANELVVAFAHVGGASVTDTPASPYLEAHDFSETVGGESYTLVYKVAGAVASENAGGTFSASGGWQSVLATYKAAPAAATAISFEQGHVLVESLAVVDAVAFGQSLTITDAVALADSAAAQRGIAQPAADTVTMSDGQAFQIGRGVTVPDTLAVADAVCFDIGLTAADTVALTDVVAQAEEIHIGDTLALADLCDPVKTTGGVNLTQPVTDTVGLADAISFDRGLTVADSVTSSDGQTFQRTVVWPIADTVGLADSASTARDIAQPLADPVTLADGQAFQRDTVQPVTDTVGLADSATTAAGKGATIADTVAPSDAVTFDRGLGVTETVALTDVVAFAEDLHISDTLALADSAAPVLTVGGTGKTANVDDTLAVADAQRFDQAHTLTDVAALADAVVTAAVLQRALADTFTPLDTLSLLELGRNRAIADTLNLADLLAFQRGLAQAIADTLSLADAQAFQKAIVLAVADLLPLTDAVSFARLMVLHDALTVADATIAKLLVGTVLNIADAVYLGAIPADKVYAGATQVWP